MSHLDGVYGKRSRLFWLVKCEGFFSVFITSSPVRKFSEKYLKTLFGGLLR